MLRDHCALLSPSERARLCSLSPLPLSQHFNSVLPALLTARLSLPTDAVFALATFLTPRSQVLRNTLVPLLRGPILVPPPLAMSPPSSREFCPLSDSESSEPRRS